MAATWTIIRDNTGVFSVGKTGEITPRMVISSATVRLDLAVPPEESVGLQLRMLCPHSNHVRERTRFCPRCGATRRELRKVVRARGWRLVDGSPLPQDGRIQATLQVQLTSLTEPLRIGCDWLMLELVGHRKLKVLNSRYHVLAVCDLKNDTDTNDADPILL